MGLLNDCPACYEQTINQCVDQLVFILGLNAGETYFFTFTDNHSKEHVVEVVADINGNVTIDTTEFPEGFFIVYSGVKVVTWRQEKCEDLCFTPCKGEDEFCCITLRPIDKSGDFEDVVVEIIPCCEDAPAVEVIVLNEINFSCDEPPSTNGSVNGLFTVENGSGNYGLQVFQDPEWVTVESGITSPFSFNINNPSAEEIGGRIIDLDTLVFSNVLLFNTTSCGGGGESLEILSITGETCEEGNLQATVNCNIVNPVGSIEIWVNGLFNGTVGGASTIINFSAVEGQNDVPIFLRDSISGLESGTFLFSFMNCDQSAILLQSLQFMGVNLTHGYTCFNVFEYSGGLLDLLREYSTDNLIFNPISNVGGWLTTNPDDIYHSNTASSADYVSGNFARVTGRDLVGNLIHSNSLQIVEPPLLSKCDPYCFAGQAGVAIHGFVDAIFNQSYALEYRLVGSGDPYTFVTDLNATAGEFGDFNFPVGAGNEVSGLNLEFRIRSSVYSWVFSGDVFTAMLPPC